MFVGRNHHSFRNFTNDDDCCDDLIELNNKNQEEVMKLKEKRRNEEMYINAVQCQIDCHKMQNTS